MERRVQRPLECAELNRRSVRPHALSSALRLLQRVELNRCEASGFNNW